MTQVEMAKSATLASRGRRRLIWPAILMTVLGGLLLFAVFAPMLSSADPNNQVLGDRLLAPTWSLGDGHVLGTDDLGRDIWLRLAYGLRTSFVVGASVVLIGMAIGVPLGLIAGYREGWLGSVIMRVADIQLSVPVLLIAMVLVAVTSGGVFTLILILGLNAWMVFARVTRSAVLALKEVDFIDATRAVGVGPGRLVTTHILPNVSGVITATATFELATAMLNEAGLSFLGFGVESPAISLGAMLSLGLEYLSSHWWLAALPGLALSTAVLVCNLLANWARDVSDVQSRVR